MDTIINSLSHAVWAQVLFIVLALSIICSTIGAMIQNRRLSHKVRDLQWTIKYLNSPKPNLTKHEF